jgi:outer membrane biosynthesis protein TonB
MGKLIYHDFELRIEREGDHYSARVLKSPAGEASTEFVLPFSGDRLENLILKIGRLRTTTRHLNSPEMSTAKELGGKLYEALFSGKVGARLQSSMNSLEEDEGLRIKLRFQDAPELSNLPWEFLYDADLGHFLSQSELTPVVRFYEIPQKIKPLTVALPLRVLVVISSPQDLACLNVNDEKAKLLVALAPLVERRVIEIDWLESVTPLVLQRKLRDKRFHIVHYIGHGGFSEKSEEGLLVLEDNAGKSFPLSAERVGALLQDQTSLRLFVLNSCEGARNSRTDPFAGIATALVRQANIPAVVAMQFEITDKAAITFSTEFYTALAEGFPVDAAVAQARKAIFMQANDVEWGTPVLFMRSHDGVLFNLENPTAETTKRDIRPQPPTPPEPEPPPAPPVFHPEPEPPPVPQVFHPEPEPPPVPPVQPTPRWKAIGGSIVAVLVMFFVYHYVVVERQPAPGPAPAQPPTAQKVGPVAPPPPTPSEPAAKVEPVPPPPAKVETKPAPAQKVEPVPPPPAKVETKPAPSPKPAPEVAYKAGNNYLKKKNYKEALKSFQTAADQGYAPAQCKLGEMYLFGEGVPKEEKRAAGYLEKAANQRYMNAEYWLGVCYGAGAGVPRNDSKAYAYLMKAARKGHSGAQYLIGTMHESGRVVKADWPIAVEWYRMAAKQGNKDAQDKLKMNLLGW